MFNFKHYRSNKEVDAAEISDTVVINGMHFTKGDYVIKNPSGELTIIPSAEFKGEFTQTRAKRVKAESTQSAPVAETAQAAN